MTDPHDYNQSLLSLKERVNSLATHFTALSGSPKMVIHKHLHTEIHGVNICAPLV